MTDYLIPATQFSMESRVANSRFIATISPAFSVDEAKQFITEIREVYRDATHNVPLFIIGFGSSLVSHSSDDGEPSGTAGRPALAVLSGSGLGDTALVITRYYGGTKLGTGGLVKAYGDSARSVIASVPKAKKVMVHQATLICPYSLYELIKNKIMSHQGIVDSEEFSENVELVFSAPKAMYSPLINKIVDLSKGKIHPRQIGSDQYKVITLNS